MDEGFVTIPKLFTQEKENWHNRHNKKETCAILNASLFFIIIELRRLPVYFFIKPLPLKNSRICSRMGSAKRSAIICDHAVSRLPPVRSDR